MRKTWILVAAVFLAWPPAASAGPELRVSLRTEQVVETKALGTVEVEGVGTVSLVAERKGSTIIVTAMGPGGAAVGRSETTVGLWESPVYVKTADGLTKISVIWNPPNS